MTATTRCKVCGDPRRPEIDQTMAMDPEHNTAIAQRYGLSKDSVRRHREHLSPALRRVIAARADAGPRRAVDRLEDLHDRASKLLDDAEDQGKPTLALAAVRELRGLVELLAKMTGELDERPQVQILNVASSPEWQQTRAVLAEALRPYPEAAAAVSAALAGPRELER